jgi:hypothetical protein
MVGESAVLREWWRRNGDDGKVLLAPGDLRGRRSEMEACGGKRP